MDDTFIFRPEEDLKYNGLLLPAVQSVREARSSADQDHKAWIEVLSVGQGTSRPARDNGDDGLPDTTIGDEGGDTDLEDTFFPSIADFDLG